MLWRAGADPHLKNKSGVSPIELAYRIGNSDVGQLADWRVIHQPPSAPAPHEEKKPNEAASGNGAMRPQFYVGPLLRRA